MRATVRAIACVVFVVSFVFLLKASAPQVTPGTWQTTGNMSSMRAGAASALLSDGRVLVMGGSDANGPLSTVEMSITTGTFAAAPAMHSARRDHSAVVLHDGRVLVTGGNTGSGATNSAEIYDPTTDTWTLLSSAMSDPRSAHTASLLPDGRVLLAGGQNSGGVLNTIEVFDPATDSFSSAGTLSFPRMSHAAAMLQDGRVLLIGGFDGTNSLTSIDIFDPSSGTVAAGPSLSVPRSASSATTLLDGTVLIAGGNDGSNDLASAEIYDPATSTLSAATATLTQPISGHRAFLLPNNNSVLIVGGTSAGTDVASSQLYIPWTGAFQPTGSMSSARPSLTGTPLMQDGLLLVTGGNNLSSAELYGFATVKTDKSDYAPGEMVSITGQGWKPGEIVTLTLVETPLLDTHPQMTAVADANGNIFNNQFSPDVHDLNIHFTLTAVGNQSGLQAQNAFTDSQPTSVNLNPTSVTVAPGASAVYTTTVVMGGNSNSCTVTLSVGTITTGASGSFSGGANPVTTNANFSRTLTITTTSSGSQQTQPGTYPFSVIASRGADCQGNGTATTSGTLIVAGSAATFAVTGFPSPTTAGASQAFTVTALDSNGNTAIGYTGTVHFTSSDAQAVLPANYTFAAADKGVHTFGGALGTVGTQSISATDTGNGGITGTQSGIVVNAGQTARLLVSGYPTPVTAGTSHSFTVTAQDAFGNLTTGYTGSVHFTSSDVAAVLPANHTFTSGPGNKDNGVATFNATLNTAGTQFITATDTAVGSITGTQVGITVNAATTNTTTTLTSSANPSTYGSPVTFTATVTRVSGSNTPTQTVVIKEGSATICTTGNLSGSSGTATGSCIVSTLSATGSPHSLTAVYGGDANFNGSTSSVLSQTVNPKALTVNGVAANNKTYDATNSATLNTAGASLVGVVSGDAVTLNTAGAGGTFSDKNVGTSKTVTISGLTISGTSVGNYTLTQPTATADITAKALTITGLTASNKSYDGTTSATLTGTAALQSPESPASGTTSDGKPYIGDVISLSGIPVGTFATKDVGNGISVSVTGLSLSGTEGGNYGLTVLALSANIGQATVTASIVGDPSKTYDGNTSALLAAANYSLSGFAPGESLTVTQTSGTYNSPDVATATTVTASLSAGDFLASAGTLASNYALPTGASGPGHINKANATVTVTPYSVTYSGTAHTATGTAKGVLNENLAGLDLSGTTHTNADDYPNDPWTFTDATGNYNNASGTVHDHIDKANAVINVVPYNVVYDGNPHIASGTAKGVLNEDLAPLNLSGTTHTNADDYANDPWTFTDVTGNYNNASGTVHDHIDKANATINVTPYDIVYDGSPHTATGTAFGVKGESLSGLSLTATTHTNPGDYSSDPWTFVDVTGNYNNASGTVHDQIRFGACSPAIGVGDAILPPINSDGSSVYSRKAGSTVPVKFRVCSAFGTPISGADLVFAPTGATLTMLSAVRGTIDNVNESGIADVPDVAFRWDASGQQWIFNMATSNLTAGETYQFRINLAYGPQSIPFVIGVK